MKKRLKFFIGIIVVLFIIFTFSTVMNKSLLKNYDRGYETNSISKNATISASNIVTVSDSFEVCFTDYDACMIYEIPLIDEKYDIKVSNINVITTNSKIDYKFEKDNNSINVVIKNNGYLGKENLVINYKMDKGFDYDEEMDSFNYELFNPNKFKSVNDFSYNITFPKVINPENVKLSYGDLTENQLTLNINSNVVAGIFKPESNKKMDRFTNLSVKFENDYFKNPRNKEQNEKVLIIFYYLITLLFFVVWFFKGKDESIAPNPTFNAPEDLSPLETGYWIDNNVDYSDIFFMLIYWANYGYIKVTKLSKQDETDGKANYVFKKVRNLDINKPQYEKDLFNAIFNLGKQENVSDEFNTKIFRTETDALYGTLQTYAQEVGEAEEKFKEYIKQEEVQSYDKEADKMFNILKFFCLLLWIFSMYFFGMQNAVSIFDYLPMIISLITVFLAFFVSKEVFFTYIIFASPLLLIVSFNTLNIAILISILLDLFLTAIVRKRTFKYNDLLGKIYGFRNVIEKAKYKNEVRQNASINPNYFYDVLPYALVLFKAKKWKEKFDNIITPDWYNSMDGESLNSENINSFIDDLNKLSEDILLIVNLSATAEKKKESREGLNYVSKTDRIKNAGLNPEDFDNPDYK